MLRKSLAALPQTLDQTYDHILSTISEEDSEYAIRILQWLTFSARPLTVEEIAEVVAIDVARDPAFDRDEVLEDPLEVLNICSSLVTITANKAEWPRPEQRIVALAHYSVQEYLVSNRIMQGSAKQYSMQEVECHNAITKGCLRYLTQVQQPLSFDILDASALARYAAEFWNSHLRKTENEKEKVSQLALEALLIEKPTCLTWTQLYDPDFPLEGPDLTKGIESIATPLYYAARLGLSTVTTMLLNQGADVNAQGGLYGNALQAASVGGHEAIVKMLLNRQPGADVNAQGGHFGNALQAASAWGHIKIVEILLDKNTNANINAQGGFYGNALQAASAEGYVQIVKMLLNSKAQVNAQGGQLNTALLAASARGHEEIVRILLNENADAHVTVQGEGSGHGSALQAASAGGYEHIVNILLAKNVDVNAKCGFYGNALQAASSKGHGQVVKILLAKKADVNAQGGEDGTALQAASRWGRNHIFKMLLDSGAMVNLQGGYYGTALQAASHGGHEHLVKVLLDNGADVNLQGGYYGTALKAAAYNGHEQLVRLLLENKADVNASGGHYRTVSTAAFCGVGGFHPIYTLLRGLELEAQQAGTGTITQHVGSGTRMQHLGTEAPRPERTSGNSDQNTTSLREEGARVSAGQPRVGRNMWWNSIIRRKRGSGML
jgi:ankyrin repeat protein